MNKTTEALKLSREIILHLLENHPTARHHRKTREALSAIDAAMEEQETVECESCGKTILECQIAGETESGGVACTDCVVSYLKDRATALECRATAISTAVMTDNQYHDSLLQQRDYLLDVLDDIASDRWSSVGKSELAIKAIAKCKEKTNEQN